MSALLARARGWAETACHAPSGDNSQPWAVTLAADGDRVTLTLVLDDATRAAPSVFDCDFAASYLSLGAFAESFGRLAGAEGYGLVEQQEQDGRFTLVFAPAAPSGADPATTADLIRRRTTNRLPFAPTPLDPATTTAFASLASAAGLNLLLYTGSEKSRLATLFTALDRFRYRHAPLYHEFLGKLRFGDEATASPDGLRDTSLGVPAPSLAFLRLLRALRGVRLLRVLFYVGLERIMAFFGCRFLISRSAAVCVLHGGDDTAAGWFALGRGFQAFWLETTRLGLALQPLGTTLLLYRLHRGERAAAFTPKEQARLGALDRRFRDDFGLDLRHPAIACRVGHGPAVANPSLRRPLPPAV